MGRNEVPVNSGMRRRLRLFSTCPSSVDARPAAYLEQACRVARWAEEWGCEGILVYADNGQLDAWTVAGAILRSTDRIAPLVAVQPVYMHPYYVAKMVTTLSNLHGRRLCLNLVAGGFKGDLVALDDTTPHDRRYERVVEYTTIVKRLLEGESVTFAGSFYRVESLKLRPTLEAALVPEIFVSGSSAAGLEAARALGATAIKYPQPPGEDEAPSGTDIEYGVRVGIIARADSREAWRTAHERFPPNRRGQLAHQLAMRASDSLWHGQLSRLAESSVALPEHPYWLLPFQNYSTMCPYLVGSYQEVSLELRRYIAAGYTTFLLDVPASEEELHHSVLAIDHALLREVAL
jgi:alkanesulfonate monooxygenase